MRVLMNMLCRIRNKILSYYNLALINAYGIHHGSHLCIHGLFGLSLAPSANVRIGDNFYMSNGFHINPLSGNVQGHFHVEDNAVLTIGSNVSISSTRIWCAESITIEDNVKIGGNVIIIDTDAHSINYKYRISQKQDILHKKNLPVHIGENVFIGMDSIILKGVTVGARSIIGAGSVVTKNIPSDCIAAGNPCKIIKYI